MKRLSRQILAIFIIIISFIGCTTFYIPGTYPGDDDFTAETPQQAPTPEPATPEPVVDPPVVIETIDDGEFRALWVATVLNLDFPTKPGLPAAAMKREIDAIVATTVDMGLNAIILQVRPTGDSFYQSDIFPWSQWLSGEQGQGIPDFDPLAYWLEACHDKDVELHAWLNPYRIIHTNTNSSDPETLAPNHPVRQNPELAVAWATPDGRRGLFLDPGLPEARQLIVDGIAELISKYDVDGIHIDDYFYPGQDFDDGESYARYGGEMERDDWRRENVNELIRNIQTAVRQHNESNDKNVRWGISPTAIWKNGSSDPLGVPTTSGSESYHAMYADTRRWVMEEWVDYICPQIYWYIGFEIADFEAIFTWWNELCAGYNVDLYIGHAAYREFEGDQPPNWEGEMVRQLEMVAGSETTSGSIFYRYFSLRSDVGESIRDFYAGTDDFPVREPVLVIDKLSVGFPASDDDITGTPANVPGHNILGTSIPDKPLYLNGEEVTTRTVEGFFHVYVPLEQGDNVFTFSQDGEQDVVRVITLRAPSGDGGGATGSPTVTNTSAHDYVTVISDDAWAYPTNSTSDSLGYMLVWGQRDRIVARSSNDMYKLSCGIWVRSSDVTVNREYGPILDVLTDGKYHIGEDYDVITWTDTRIPVIMPTYDGNKLNVSFGMHSVVPPLEMPADLSETLFESVRSGINSGAPYYDFVIRDDARFEGYHVEIEENKFHLYLKKRKTLADGEMPLADITIMLDPGHGGSDSAGAIGPLGHEMSEKQLNLINAQKLKERLEALGASVLLTRDSDITVSPQERVIMSHQAKPDLFISLHINSIAEITDARNIRGFSVWYKNESSVALAETTLDIMQYINPGTNRNRVINQANFYVCRPEWSPHILLEASFISNVDDFVWLIDETEQDRMATATVDVILEYFKNANSG